MSHLRWPPDRVQSVEKQCVVLFWDGILDGAQRVKSGSNALRDGAAFQYLISLTQIKQLNI